MSSIPTSPNEDPRDAHFDVTDLQADLGRQTGRSASAILIFSFLRLALTIVSTAILARLVPPAEQGLVAVVMPVVLIATGLSEFGLSQAVVQRETITHRVVSALFWVNLALGMTLTLVAVTLAPAAAAFYDQPRVAPILMVLAPYILLSVMTVQYVAILRRKMRVRVSEICNFAGIFVGAVLSVGAAILGAGPWALVIQLLASQGSSLLFLFLAVRWIPSAPWKSALREARSAIVFGGYLSAERLINDLLFNLQTVVIGRSFGGAEAGLFYRSQTFAEMPRRRIAGPLAGAFIPSLSRLQHDPDGFRAMYVRQLSRGNLIMIPISLLLILIPDALVLILLGKDWSAAAPILGWLGLLPLTALFSSCTLWAMLASGRPRELFLLRLATAVPLIITLIMAARFDVTTFVAVYTLLQVLVILPISVIVITYYTPLDKGTYWRALMPDVVFCLVIGGICFALRSQLTLEPIPEGIIVGVIVMFAQALRILAVPTLRKDVMKVFRR